MGYKYSRRNIMTSNKVIKKQTKWFISIIKEKLWLEEMALEGWFLIDMVWGVRYTFEKREPKKVIYEVDRFNLPKSPTLKDIRHKQEFLTMATEMGWQVVVHDEDQNHYLCKEYKEGEINELYNDSESKEHHAKKYSSRYHEFREIMLSLTFFMSILGLIIATMNKFSDSNSTGFIIFIFGYLVFCLGCNLLYKKLAHNIHDDLLMTTKEWKEHHINGSNNKIIRKLYINDKKFTQFLWKQSMNGWHITKMSNTKHVFIKGEPGNYIYTMDNKYLTNQRIKILGLEKLKDSKDWYGTNNDWQLQSLKDAESKNWSFVCAMENQTILYRSKENQISEELNDKKYEKGFHINSFVEKIGIWFFIGGIIGLVVGIAMAVLT